MKKIFSISIIFLFVIFSGCQTSMYYLNEGVKKYNPTTPENIKVYSERDIKKETIEIGYVATHITNTQNGDELKKAIRDEASLIGADAIIDFKIIGTMARGIAVKYK